MLTNPFALYILGFGAATGAYFLGWSYVYPPLSYEMVLFLGLSFAVAAILGLAVQDNVARIRLTDRRLPDWMIWPLGFMFAADLLYAGIPLKKLLEGTFVYGSADIGIPHVHVFLVTFGMTFGVIRFADFVAS